MTDNTSYCFTETTDLKAAESVWRQLSPNKSLFDTWEFRYCFYKYFKFPLKFIVAKTIKTEEIIGLLALQYDPTEKYWEFFGGNWMEENKILVKPGFEAVIPLLYQQVKDNAALMAISTCDNEDSAMVFDDFKYVLDLKNYQNYEDVVLAKFGSKRQSNSRREIKKITDLGVKIILDNPNAIEQMFKLNKNNFGKESSFNMEFRKEIYRDFAQLPFKNISISIEIAGKIQAVSYGMVYNNSYYFLNSGSNTAEISNLGSYLNLLTIQQAIDLHCERFDALMTSYNWKERWHFEKIPLYKYLVN